MTVCISGIAIRCSIGSEPRQVAGALRDGKSGRRPVERLDLSHAAFVTKQAAELEPTVDPNGRREHLNVLDLAAEVAESALADAGLSRLNLPKRFGLALGTSHGSNASFMKLLNARVERPPSETDARLAITFTPTIQGRLAKTLSLTGPCILISTACASGANSIGKAAELIEDGRADYMIAGGVDLFTELSFSGFNILGALARGQTRPLDTHRDGLMLGDGAAFIILERLSSALARGVTPWGFVAGHSLANEAWHATGPHPQGRDAARVVKQALDVAGVSAEQVDYINVHGTGTIANDESELRALATIFGEHPRALVSSTKSQVGHTLGAAGSVEVVTTLIAAAFGFAPPTINLNQPIAGYESWHFVKDRGVDADIKVALSTSFGFAGNLSALVLTMPDNQARSFK